MNGTNLFKIAFRALANNKLRAFLTMLGIIIGVASVITMLAIGQGSKKSIQAQISEMGSNMIMIHPGADMRGGVRQDPSAMQTLKLTDYEALRNETNFLAAVSPNVSSSGQLIAGNNNYPSSVSGVGTDYLEIRQLTVENGTMFTETDIQTSAKVCVIGKTIQDNLFPNGEDPVGRIIRFNQVPFRVTGVLKAKGYNSMGMDQDDVVLAPYTTVMKRLLAQTYLQGIFASALTEDMTDNATEEITGGLIGVIIGCGASWIVKSAAHWPIYIQAWSVFLSFAVCTVTGVFFGWYPAKKAADLDPIEAIRYE